VIGNPLLLGDEGGYNLTRSLRFRSSASAYLNRTFGTPTNNTTWSWSAWIKRGGLGAGANSILWAGAAGNLSGIGFTSDLLTFYASAGTAVAQSTAVFRDPAAWYHMVFISNGTTIVAYVNNVQVLSYTGTLTQLNAAGEQLLCCYRASSSFFDGYMAEVNFIDGQALTPSSFGAYSIYNQWLPKKYAGTYGTNGFYLPFTNNASAATLGNDFSGNSNTWTTNNISLTAGSTYDSMTDVPTLTSVTAANYAVLNAVDIGYSAVLSEANLKISTASSGNAAASSTMAMTGNTYWEVTIGSNSQIGLIWGPASDAYGSSKLSMFASGATGSLNNATRTLSATPSWSNGDTLGLAWSSSARTLTLYQAGSATAVMTILTPTTGDPMIAITNYTSGAAMSSFLNCGQRPFTYTPPSGYVALNTFNL